MKISQKTLISINQKLDYIPVVSAATGIVNIVTKIALDVFLYFNKDTVDLILQENKYLCYIKEKCYLQTIFIMIPGLNIFIAYVAMKDARRFADQAIIDRMNLTAFRLSAQDLQVLCEELSENPSESLSVDNLNNLNAKLADIRRLADLCYSRDRGLKVACDLIAKFRVLCSQTTLRAHIKVIERAQISGTNMDEITKKILEEAKFLFIDQIKTIEKALPLDLVAQ